MGRQEDPIHKGIVKYLKAQYPHDIVHHAVNEGNRGGRKGLRDGAHRKAMGVCAGFPDLIMPMRLWAFEVKPEGKYATKVQRDIGEKLMQAGWKWAVVRSIDDVIEKTKEWEDGTTSRNNRIGD